MERAFTTLLKPVCLATAVLLALSAAFYAALNIFAQIDPLAASQISTRIPEVVSKAVRPLVGEKAKPESVALALPLITGAFRSNPLEVRVVEAFSLAMDKQNRARKAAELMRLAGALTPHVPSPHVWILDRALASQDFQTAANELNILFRTRSEHIESLMAAIDNAGTHPKFLLAMALQLEKEPPWRKRYLYWISKNSKDITNPILLFDSIKNIGGKATIDELSTLLNRLVAENRATQAYALWIQAIFRDDMSRIDHVYNGSFEHTPLKSPFDWTLWLTNSITTSYELFGDGPQRALTIDFFDGRQKGFGLRQILLLAPGSWEFSGRWRATDVTAPRGLVWTVTCRPSGVTVEVSPTVQGSIDIWTSFSKPFTVPAEGCEHQELMLAAGWRSAADHDYRGQISVTGLRVARIAEPAGEPRPSSDAGAGVLPATVGGEAGALQQKAPAENGPPPATP